jgi:integrase
MPRRPGIWLRSGTDWYYTTIDGEKVRLSKDKAEAERMFHQLLSQKGIEQPEPAAQLGPSFKKLADEFLVNTKGDKNPETVAIQGKVLQAFCDRNKGLRAADLKGHTVVKWIAWENEWRAKKGRKPWGTSTQALAIKTIKAACNWGVKIGYLKEHPIKRLSPGKVARRERIITTEERRRIREFVQPEFAEFLFVVEKTGARPYKEIGLLEAKHIDFEQGTATLVKHKNARKTGKPRVIYLVAEVLDILKERAERYPEGFLFRTRRDSAWNQSNSMKWMTLIREKLGIDFMLYHLRHTYITEAIINGVPVEVIAELVGNTPEIIHRHYAHVAKNKDALKAAARKAIG